MQIFVTIRFGVKYLFHLSDLCTSNLFQLIEWSYRMFGAKPGNNDRDRYER